MTKRRGQDEPLLTADAQQLVVRAATFACYADALCDRTYNPTSPCPIRGVNGLSGYMLAWGWIGDDGGHARTVLVNVVRITGCVSVDQEDGRPDPVEGWEGGMRRVRLSYKRDAGLPDTVTIVAPFGYAICSMARAMEVFK